MYKSVGLIISFVEKTQTDLVPGGGSCGFGSLAPAEKYRYENWMKKYSLRFLVP